MKFYELQSYDFKISVRCGLFGEIGLTFTFSQSVVFSFTVCLAVRRCTNPWLSCKSPFAFCLCPGAAGTCKGTVMASPEDVIEPAAQSSMAQNLGRRRFLHDLHNLSPDEIDGLMSSSGEKNSPPHKYIKLKVRDANLNKWTNEEFYWNDLPFKSQRVVLSLWCIISMK